MQRGDDWAKTNRYTNRQTGTTTRTIRTDEGSAITKRGQGGGAVGVGEGGNVYAGKDGNVYRREDGTWQKHENGGWSDTDRQPWDRPTPHDRSTTGSGPARWIAARRISSIAMQPLAARAANGPGTTGPTGEAAARAARAAIAAAAEARGGAGAGGGAEQSLRAY